MYLYFNIYYNNKNKDTINNMSNIKNFNEFINEATIFDTIDQYDQEGEYVGIKLSKNALTLYLTDDGRAKISEDTEKSEVNFIEEYFEDIQVNSEIDFHDDLGERGFGLTEAPGFSIEYGYNDDGEYVDSNGHGQVFYYDNYMITNFIEVLQRDGKVIFNKV
jgi:hypothetical protein